MLELLPSRHPEDTVNVAARMVSDIIFIILHYLISIRYFSVHFSQFLHLKSRILPRIFPVKVFMTFIFNNMLERG